MSRPTLYICRRCEDDRLPKAQRQARTGEALFRAVKALRKREGLKDVFALEGVKCLKLCDEPCALMLKGKKRSTYARSCLDALASPRAVVQSAVAYAALAQGEELPERALPGESAD